MPTYNIYDSRKTCWLSHFKIQTLQIAKDKRMYSMRVCAKINFNADFENEEKNKSLLHYRLKMKYARMVNSFENKWDDRSKPEAISYEVHVRVRQVPFSMNWKWNQVAESNKFALISAVIPSWFSVCACQATSSSISVEMECLSSKRSESIFLSGLIIGIPTSSFTSIHWFSYSSTIVIFFLDDKVRASFFISPSFKLLPPRYYRIRE